VLEQCVNVDDSVRAVLDALFAAASGDCRRAVEIAAGVTWA